MKQQIRITAAALVAALGLGLLAPAPAEAGRTGRRNTALVLGAVAAYGIIKKKPLIAGAAGAGAIYSFMRSQQSDRNNRRNRRERRNRRPRRVVYRDRVVERPVYYSSPRYAAPSYAHHRHSGPGQKRGWVNGMPPGQAKKYYGR